MEVAYHVYLFVKHVQHKQFVLLV